LAAEFWNRGFATEGQLRVAKSARGLKLDEIIIPCRTTFVAASHGQARNGHDGETILTTRFRRNIRRDAMSKQDQPFYHEED
jgi:hypothetical protein